MPELDLDYLLEKASNFIDECPEKQCLLLFDLVGSKQYDSRSELQQDLKAMTSYFNSKFAECFPTSNIGNLVDYQKGFQYILGDGSWAVINDPTTAKNIIEYHDGRFPHIPVRWNVARDGFDNDNIEIVRHSKTFQESEEYRKLYKM